MADLTTYKGLCEAVADYLGRDDMAERIPTFIALAEKRMNRELRLRVMERRSEASVLAGQSAVPLPWRRQPGHWDVFLEMRDLTFDGIISRCQDVTEIIRQNRAAQNVQKCGFQKAPVFRRVASIPVAVADIAAAQGLDILNDPGAMRRFLNDPDNRAFRTTLERV